jgi:hypothetical protein
VTFVQFPPGSEERVALAAELKLAVDEARQRVGIPALCALLGNEIRICIYHPVNNWHRRISQTFKVFGPEDMRGAIEFLNGMGTRGLYR